MTDRWVPGERIAGEVAEAILRRVDLDEVLAHVDIDALVARIDVDALLQRVDVDALVARMDVDALSRRIPIGDLVSTADIQRAVDHIDLGPALERAGLADIVASSVGRSTIDTVRRRIVEVDALVERLSGQLLRQDVDSWPAGPYELVGDEKGPLGTRDAGVDGEDGYDVAGHYAGPLARIVATTLDIAGAVGSWSVLVTFVLSLLGRGFGVELDLAGSQGSTGFLVGLALWMAVWFLLPLEVFGRTPSMSVMGMRVVTAAGGPVGFRRTLGRTLLQLPSVLLLGLGYLPMLFDKRRRAAHDLIAGTAVVWDWGDREATIGSPLGRWVAGHTEIG